MEHRDQRRIRDALASDFGTVCAYCEQPCEPPTFGGEARNSETVDHFRPRSRFMSLSLNWPNLIYACQRCNQRKDNKWPGYDDTITNQMLSAMSGRYTVPSEYVNPNASDGVRTAREFFNFDMDSCEVVPAVVLNDSEWSAARRTIWDVDLNDTMFTSNDPRHLVNQRRYQRYLLIEGLNSLNDVRQQIGMIRAFTEPNQPYSSFIYSYVMNTFPAIAELLEAG